MTWLPSAGEGVAIVVTMLAWGAVRRLRSRGDAAARGDRLEHAQPPRVDHA
jgi:hypothetical protein